MPPDILREDDSALARVARKTTPAAALAALGIVYGDPPPPLDRGSAAIAMFDVGYCPHMRLKEKPRERGLDGRVWGWGLGGWGSARPMLNTRDCP
jgi:hypothetical protein